jgi:hypothetical protein
MSLDRSSPVNVSPSGTTPIDDATMADGSKRQIVAIGSGDSAGGSLVADVATSQPAGTENGLIVREAQKGQATMANSRPVVLASDEVVPIVITDRVVTGAINGASQHVTINMEGRNSVAVAWSGTWTGSLFVEGTVDGSTWTTLDLWQESLETWIAGNISGGTNSSWWVELVGAMVQLRVSSTAAAWTGTANVTVLATNQGMHTPEYAGGLNVTAPPNAIYMGGVDPNGKLQGLSVDASGVQNTHVTPQTTGGLTVSRFLSAASTNALNAKASAGQVYGWSLQNNTATARFVKLYNKATSPTVGTDTPFMTLMVPPNSGNNLLGEIGIPFSLGISVAITANPADSDTTVVGSNDVIFNLFYK